MARKRLIAGCVTLVAVVVLGACDKGSNEPLGSAADPADADQVVEISTSDELRFDPSEIEVAAGETIEFRITNEGKSPHEFVLGPSHEHEEGMHHGEGNATGSIEPGDTASVFWSFPEAGETQFACHIAGHDQAGMTGTVTVTD